MRSPAPRANAENRAELVRNKTLHTTTRNEPEADFAAIYLARPFGLATSLAHTTAALKSLRTALIGSARATVLRDFVSETMETVERVLSE